MKKCLYFSAIAFFLASCNFNRGAGNTCLYLRPENLFNPDSVSAFLSAASLQQAESSKRLFLNAVNLFKNKGETDSAIAFFTKSLNIYPTASAYYELGDALLAQDSAHGALEAFKMAERLDYAPLGNVLFKEACCYAALGDDKTRDYLQYAIENGFVDRGKIIHNNFFTKYNEGDWAETVYNQTMAGSGDADAVLWQGYSRQFEPAAFPLVIDSGTFRGLGKPVYISYDYDRYITEMRDKKFSRDVGNDFFYYAQVVDTTAFKTVIYGVKTYEENGGPVYYYMASFNNKGLLVDKKMVAGAKTFKDLYNVLTMQGRAFQVQQYKLNYQKSTDTDGFEDNAVLSRDLVKTTSYIVDPEGRFAEVTQQ